MDTIWIIIIALSVGLAVLVLAGAWLAMRKQHTSHLQSTFGREYEYEIARKGKRSEAEKELDARKERVAKLDIRKLDAEEYRLFAGRWKDAQAAFVDDPSRAVILADALCLEVMEARGYPVGDFEQRAADISVDHPNVVSNYRAANQIAIANADEKATTEELRRAMKHYQALFNDLLETEASSEAEHARVHA